MGLYDDDKSATTKGDIADVIYWQTKFANEKLQAALASRQPEYPIRFMCVDVINGCNDLLKEFPNHEDIKGWKSKAESIQKKCSDTAPAEDVKTSFQYWKDHSYESSWRFSNLARMFAAQDEWAKAKSFANDALTHFGRLADRSAQWPDDIKAWITKAKADTEALYKQAQSKT
jgi:hypothetical protein